MAPIFEIRLEQPDGTWATKWRTTSRKTAQQVLAEQRRRAKETHGRGAALYQVHGTTEQEITT